MPARQHFRQKPRYAVGICHKVISDRKDARKVKLIDGRKRIVQKLPVEAAWVGIYAKARSDVHGVTVEDWRLE